MTSFRSTARELEDECLIGGYHVPKHVTINIPIYAIHHCEEFWTNHDQFDPERLVVLFMLSRTNIHISVLFVNFNNSHIFFMLLQWK